MANNVKHGTVAKRKAAPKKKNPNAGTKKKQPPPASAPTGGKKKARKAAAALNPGFDPRMRAIGSPLNRTSQIKRGWIQSADDKSRVNFLFNPSQLDLTHQVDPNNVRLDSQTPPAEVTDPYYVSSGSSTGVKLLYDRTYELFSAPKNGVLGFANHYGVWADIAAWYVFLGMLPKMPTSWDNSIITSPAKLIRSYLFVGPKLVYYGWVTGLNVTYSHWTQDMIPQRCSVDIGFQILPHTGNAPVPTDGLQTGNPKTDAASSWLSEYFSWQGF